MDINRRTRMISLRISEEEYHTLKTFRQEYGARSLSELTRIALKRIIGNTPSSQDAAVQFRLDELDGRLKAIESQFTGAIGPKQ